MVQVKGLQRASDKLIAPSLRVTDLTKLYTNSGRAMTLALDDLSFSVCGGSFVSFLGPSGCGKTTLIKCLGGIAQPTAGEIRWDESICSGPPEGIIVVFQDYSKVLLPWRTAALNVSLPLEWNGFTRNEIRGRVVTALSQVGLTDYAGRYPMQLSGGMQQRVQIARALACCPRALLLDEPFASLDALTKAEMQDQLLQLWKEIGMTILAVTHDIDEAVYLSDRVIVLGHRGRIVADIPIPLERPRHQIRTKSALGFNTCRAALYDALTTASQRSASGPCKI